MYYIILGIAIILVYSFVAKLLSSLLKGCMVIVGLALLIGAIYVFLASSSKPITILDRWVVEDFSVREVEK